MSAGKTVDVRVVDGNTGQVATAELPGDDVLVVACTWTQAHDAVAKAIEARNAFIRRTGAQRLAGQAVDALGALPLYVAGRAKPASPRELVVAQMLAERAAQDDKWGEQNHPDGTGVAGAAEAAEWARRVCQKAADNGELVWLDILAEEFHEAAAETDPVKLRAELVQVMAVAANWIEAIDRRGAGDR